MTPEQEARLLEDVREIKLSIQGDVDFGIKGLVNEVASLQRWRVRLDTRILLISGFVAGLVTILKYLLVNK